MITVPIGLDEETIAKVDALVRKGLYKNRSEALRDQIIKGISRISLLESDFSQSDLYQQLLDKLLSLPDPPNLLPTIKSVTELVSEGRER